MICTLSERWLYAVISLKICLHATRALHFSTSFCGLNLPLCVCFRSSGQRIERWQRMYFTLTVQCCCCYFRQRTVILKMLFSRTLFKTIVTRYFLLQGFCTAPGLKMPAMMCTEASRRPDAPGEQMAPRGRRNELFTRAAIDFFLYNHSAARLKWLGRDKWTC